MTHLENALRQRLNEAAEAAPVLASLNLTEPAAPSQPDNGRPAALERLGEPRRPHRRRTAVFAGLAASIAIGSVSLWQSGLLITPNETGVICAGELAFNGAIYVSVGDLTRVPRAGDSWGTAEWTECVDHAHPTQVDTQVMRVDGVAGDDVFLAEGHLWLRVGATLPAALTETTVAVPCTQAGHIVGLVEGVDRMPQADGDALQLPFTATIRANQGSALDFSQFPEQVVNVTVDSVVVSDSELLTSSLADGTPVDITVTCAQDSFVADSVTTVQ